PVFVPDAPPDAPQRETTATATAAATGPGYWLQFGAFGRLDAAEALRERVAQADLGLLPLLTIVREAGLNRLRAGPFPSGDEAR
ncbi:SPOR domain-containing protein, partial [Acinetobacter baumannii]